MSNIISTPCRCGKCGASYSTQVHSMVNTAAEPDLKAKVLSGELFVSRCPHCGAEMVVSQHFLYLDPASRLLVLLSNAHVDDTAMDRDMTARQVTTVGELIEKVKIFESGLDDVVLELSKYVTCQELGRELDLKFLKLDGADGELIMTYPDKGQMEMLAIGFNVYEDCRGIVSRTPAISEAARGLTMVDQEWIGSFVR